jgi:hypothetical protein
MGAKVYKKIGAILIIISCLLWIAVFFVPMLPFSFAEKALIVTSSIVISEVIFWLGILLVGKEFAHRYRQQLNPAYWWQKITHRR